jgi:hypothetical protein
VDAFEQLVSEILWMTGFWVRTSVKVELTKEEKRLIGRHSAPRWELDIVGYSARDNVLPLPFACDDAALRPMVLFLRGELRLVVGMRLACGERF